jgi:hypothetical protein
VTELLLGLKTPLVEKGPVPRRATPAANGIGVAAPALAGMPDRIKVEPVTVLVNYALATDVSCRNDAT